MMKQRTNRKETEHRNQTGRWVAICLFWLAVWQVGAMLVDSALLLPSPAETLQALALLAVQKEFYLNVLWTFFRCVLAMLLSFFVGALCAWFAYRSRTVRALLKLPVSFFKAVPVMAVIIYVILLLSSDWVAVPVCFLMCFPVVYTNLLDGLDAVPPELPELAAVYELSEAQKRRLLYFPALVGPIRASIRLIAGLSWKAVVAAEVLSVPAYSLGYQMMRAKYYLETPQLFAYIAVIVALSIAFEKLIGTLAERLAWKNYKGSRLTAWFRNEKNKTQKQTTGKTRYAAPTVAVQHVSKAFDGKPVLCDWNAVFETGCVTALMGPSGAGKTTLARMLSGLAVPDSGTVRIDGTYRLSMLFQEDRLLPWLNVYDNIALSFLNPKRREGGAQPEEADLWTETKIDVRIRELAKALEISDVLWKLPEELSGGMRYRVSMGRTFAAPAELLILDEPFRGLDEALKARMIDRLWKKETAGKTVIFITHSPQDSSNLAEREEIL